VYHLLAAIAGSRDTGMKLEPIWRAAETTRLQGEIWKGECPQCWTACEAYQSMLGNALALRRRPGSVTPDSPGAAGAMTVSCFADA
jgi:hypothetical protein